MEELLSNKKFEELKPVYLIQSRSDKVIAEKVKEIKSYFKDKIDFENDLKIIDENDYPDLNLIFNFVNTLSFFSLKKVLIIKNINKTAKELLNYLLEFFDENSNLKDNCIIFIFANDLKKVANLVKCIEKFGEIIKIDYAVSEDLKKRLAEKSELDGVKFTPNASLLFIENINDDPILFEIEYQKLLSYIYFEPKKIITENIVRELVKRNVETTIFDFVDYVGMKKFKDALNTINDLVEDYSATDNIFLIKVINSIYRLFKFLMYYKSDKNGPKSSYDYLLKTINAKPYFINKIYKKYQVFEKKYSYEEVKKVLETLNIFDIKRAQSLKKSYLEDSSYLILNNKTFIINLILNIQLATKSD